MEFMQIKKNRTALKRETIKYIVIHDTGNPDEGADALMHYRYFNTVDRGASADFFVDSTQTIQVNDYNKYYTWHCGDGKGKYGITNKNSIGIEMCINADGDYNTMLRSTIDLVKDLKAILDVPIDNIVRHYDASRKTCPGSMSWDGWKAWFEFKKALEPPVYPTVKKGDNNEYVTALQQKLTNLFYYTGSIDGVFGPVTHNAVYAYQLDHKLQPDGICGKLTWTSIFDEIDRLKREIARMTKEIRRTHA